MPIALRLTLAALALSVVCWAVGAPSLEYGFVYDDHAVIVERPSAFEEGVATFLQQRHWGTGRHAALASLDLDRRTPLSPSVFHATNTLLAVVATLLAFTLALTVGLGIGPSFMVALLFAVHPAHVDAVVSIVGRAELLAFIGVVGALIFHLRGYPGGSRSTVAAALLFLLALGSKENALSLFPLLVLADVLLLPRRGLATVARPYAVYALCVAVWLGLVAGNLSGLAPVTFADNPLAHTGALERIPKAAAVLWSYLAIVAWPLPLLPDRSYATTDPTLAHGWIALGAWLLAAAGCIALRKRSPRLVFCLAWFPAAFIVTSNVLWPIGTIMAERLLFLPSLGPILLVGLLLQWLGERGRLIAFAGYAPATIAALVLAFAYDARARYWIDDAHYHTAAAELSPRSAKANYNLGLLLAREQRFDEASRYLARAVDIYPEFARANYYLAASLQRQGSIPEAARVYRRYLIRKPNDAAAHSQLLSLQILLDDRAGALATAERLVELEPDNPFYATAMSNAQRRAAQSRLSP